jgi:hypothetical protein
MDVPLMPFVPCGSRWLGVTGLAALAVLAAAPRLTADGKQTAISSAEVKAAFLYNFAKFAEWPSRPPSEPIALCIVGDEAIAGILVETVRDKAIDGRPLHVERPQDSASWRGCHVLFIAEAQAGRSRVDLRAIQTLPVLTVSDGKDFSETGGMIELYLERGRMRFLVNVDAVERSTMRLSSQLLGLARITRDGLTRE